jgi:hypothetical protein
VSPDVPGGITSSPATGDRFYENKPWGFRVTLPDSTWAISADEAHTVRQANGLPSLLVRFYVHLPGTPMKPMIVLRPFARTEGEVLDTLAMEFDAQYRATFGNYVPSTRRTTTVGGENAVEWNFTSREVRTQGDHYLANQFLATVLVHKDQIYSFLASGRPEEFPSTRFAEIIRSLSFSR